MKNFRNLSALILSAAASLTLLAGCGAAPVEDTIPAESAPAVPVVEKTAPEAETTPEAAPEETPAPESDLAEEKAESLREFRFTTGLGIYDDFSQDYDIHFDYTDGKASASFDAAQAAALEGSPYVLEVTDLTLKDDGTPDTLSAYTDCVVYIEFNEDGLPSFFAVAQEDVGYRITYTRTDDGRLAMDSAQCVYGYIYNHSAEPTNDFFTPTGEILYQ